MKCKFLLVFVLFAVQAKAQKNFQDGLHQSPVIHFDSSTVQIELAPSNKKVKPADDKFYYWYGARDIKRTRGDFSGKLLHGQYSEFYLNKNLKEKGKLRYGLKYGTWKSWHFNGEYNEISKWEKGDKHGKYIIYTKKGRISEIGKFKKDRQVGVKKVYSDGKISSKVRYKKGSPVEKKVKPAKKKEIKEENEGEKVESEVKDSNDKKKTKTKKIRKKRTKQDKGGGKGKVQKEAGQKKKPKKEKKKKKRGEVKIRRMIKFIPLKNDTLKET